MQTNPNLTQDIHILLDAFIHFAFVGKCELGWDDSMARCVVNGQTRYKIRCGKNYYVTDHYLSNISAQEISGRATRVWLAKGKDNRSVALKDVWLDEGCLPEDEVQKAVLDSIEDEELRRAIESRLFTILDCEKVKVSNKEDNTRDAILRGLSLDGYVRYLGLSHNTSDDPVVQISESVTPSVTPPNVTSGIISDVRSRKIQHRYHYRVVFKEVATPLNRCNGLPAIFRTCGDASVGRPDFSYHFPKGRSNASVVLGTMGDAGWIHRDISAGNIYVYGEGCLIGDLEYAKAINALRGHHARVVHEFMLPE